MQLKALYAYPTVSVNAFNASGYFHLVVRDNGPGIDEETRAKMYDPCFTTKPIGQGVGLGLSVTLNIVQKLGGAYRAQLNWVNLLSLKSVCL